jgi:hypothetical protein
VIGHTNGASRYAREGMEMVEESGFPRCQKCDSGLLLPLSDYGRDGAPIRYKAWVCSNPDCGFNLRIDNGEITLGRQIGQSYK